LLFTNQITYTSVLFNMKCLPGYAYCLDFYQRVPPMGTELTPNHYVERSNLSLSLSCSANEMSIQVISFY